MIFYVVKGNYKKNCILYTINAKKASTVKLISGKIFLFLAINFFKI